MGLLPLHENLPTLHNFVIPTEAERSERSGEPALSEVEGDLVLACVATRICRREPVLSEIEGVSPVQRGACGARLRLRLNWQSVANPDFIENVLT
jgi:hypothetical protein